MSPENTVAPPTSQKRIDANRKNAQRSTGPRTPEGKSRSRFNGLQHGLAATVPVLPGEDPAAFQARVDAVMDSFAPQNQVEVELLERVAATSWSLDRATRAEVARLSHKIRHDAIEREQRENEEAVALGQRLLWSARGPWQLYPHSVSMGLKWERRISWSENPADPNNPALLVTRLERTVAGCRWLLDRWAELWARLEPGEVCVAPDQFKATRLLGKQPLDAVDDPEVTQIFTASFELLPDGQNGKAFAPLERELMANRHEDDVYNKELRRRQLPKLKPPDADAAREVLKALVDRQTSRLKLILARNQEIAEADAAEAPDRLAFDTSPEGEKLRRYVLSAARLVNQTVKTYLSVVRRPLSVADSSFVPGPLSSVPQHDQAACEPSAAQDDQPACEPGAAQEDLAACQPGARHGRDQNPRTEANAGPDGTSNNGQLTTDHGQSTQIPRTEPNAGPTETSSKGQRTKDNGPRTIDSNSADRTQRGP
ncbi:MAG: hypothetical protein ACLQVF_21905 [Isosphaeraceae bacterium]